MRRLTNRTRKNRRVVRTAIMVCERKVILMRVLKHSEFRQHSEEAPLSHRALTSNQDTSTGSDFAAYRTDRTSVPTTISYLANVSATPLLRALR